jgi:hypothetical protein
VICPFLGMFEDSGTALAFPSAWNHCHHCNPASSVALDHQKTCCLTGGYETCPAFLQSPNDAFPIGLQNVMRTRPFNRSVFWIAIFVIPVLLTAAYFLGQKFPVPLFSEKFFPVIPSPYVSPILLPASITPFLEPSSLVTFTPSPVPIANNSGSRVTPIITRRPHGLEEWIGVNYIFIIYRVKQGWSIERLAVHYNTTVAAVQAVNYKLITPLFPGQLVIIPINQRDVSGLPKFEVYRVTEDITVEKLAAQLDVAPDQLRDYNAFGKNEMLMAMEWIIVPREQAETK